MGNIKPLKLTWQDMLRGQASNLVIADEQQVREPEFMTHFVENPFKTEDGSNRESHYGE